MASSSATGASSSSRRASEPPPRVARNLSELPPLTATPSPRSPRPPKEPNHGEVHDDEKEQALVEVRNPEGHRPGGQARRQLPIQRSLALKYTAIASVDSLRDDIVEAALAQLFAVRELNLRRAADFRHVQSEFGRALFPTSMEWLALVEEALAAYAELTPWLEQPLMGYARANYDDLREQLGALVHPGFVREVERSRLAHYSRYLKAMRLRAERLRQDATRDQARMLTVRGYWRDYLKLKAERGEDAELAELRWLIEELRVSLFAQELGTAESVSPKRLTALVERLAV